VNKDKVSDETFKSNGNGLSGKFAIEVPNGTLNPNRGNREDSRED